MLQKTPRSLGGAARIGTIVTKLIRRYGIATHFNKGNPLDELVFIVLSSQTDEAKYVAVFRDLKRRYRSWKYIGPNDAREVEVIIRPAGLSRVKAGRLISIFGKIRQDFGVLSLARLQAMSCQEAEEYLCSLPGVGKKTARCVLMYSLKREVFPVDTHTFRVLRRLGIHQLPDPARRWHDEIQEMVPRHLRAPLHVTLVSLGRDLCKAVAPKCNRCPLRADCAHANFGVV